MMKAVVITEAGGPEVLQVQERPVPKVGPYEVLIEVKAAGVNRPDVFQRQGKYPAPVDAVQDIPGLEVSGVIVALGAACTSLSLNERVMALVPGGGYAQYVAVDAGICIPIPDSLNFIEAGGIPETLFTVWHNVVERGALVAGERFLVHGGAGGIGSTAIQVAKLLGAEVYTTVGAAEKEAYVQMLGATEVVNYQVDDFESRWRSSKVNLILDSIGGEYFGQNINILADEGRLIMINAMQGAKVELNLMKVMHKRISISGSTLRSRSVEFKRALASAIRNGAMPWIESGAYKTYVAKTYPFQEANSAHQLMESHAFQGKIILTF